MKYKPFYVWRAGVNLHTITRIDLLNKYVVDPDDEPIPPPPDDPIPPPPPDPAPPPPEPDPVPPPPDDPIPPPPDPPPPPPPELDDVWFPGIAVLAKTYENRALSHRAGAWWRVDDAILDAWEIVSVEHLRLTLLEYVNPWRALVIFDLDQNSPFYTIVSEFCLMTGGIDCVG